MKIWMTGIDHNKADINVRSKFSFTSKRKALAYEAFLNREDVEGCVILSTCNRTEVWMSVKDEAQFSPFYLLCSHLNEDPRSCQEFFEEREDSEAVDHLFRLAAGLESKIVGEDQIITQVGDAVAFARSCYATDNTLEVLFRHAVTAGKRVRTETDLSTADRSVIHTALRNLEEKGVSVQGKHCMVIGNGMMGKLSAQTLMDYGADVTVTVRKYHNGVVDVPAGCRRISYDERYSMLPDCDIVVSATSSPNYTIKLESVEDWDLPHKIRLIDLAVPRDVEPEVGALPWADLYDIDSFRIDIYSEKFQFNLEKAETILNEVKEDFYKWYEGRDYVPLIQDLKGRAGEDVIARMTPVMKRLSLDAKEKSALSDEVKGASSRMMNRLLFGLRTKLTDKEFRDVMDAMSEVFSEK